MASSGQRNGGGEERGDRTPERAALHVKAALLREALEDAEFRELALRNPEVAIKRGRFVNGADKFLAKGYRFRVVEETSDLLYVVIPHNPPGVAFDPDNPKDVLMRKAVADPEYLRRLTEDPKSVIEAEFLVDVPQGFDVKVLRETSVSGVAVLPADLRPPPTDAIPRELLEYQASAWGGGGCGLSIFDSLFCPPATDFQGPFPCTQDDPGCEIQPL